MWLRAEEAEWDGAAPWRTSLQSPPRTRLLKMRERPHRAALRTIAQAARHQRLPAAAACSRGSSRCASLPQRRTQTIAPRWQLRCPAPMPEASPLVSCPALTRARSHRPAGTKMRPTPPSSRRRGCTSAYADKRRDSAHCVGSGPTRLRSHRTHSRTHNAPHTDHGCVGLSLACNRFF